MAIAVPQPLLAQVIPPPPDLPSQEVTPPRSPDFDRLPVLPEDSEELPSLEDLFPSLPDAPDSPDQTAPPPPPGVSSIRFTNFRLQGSQSFDDEALTTAIRDRVTLPRDRPASSPELELILQATYRFYREEGRLLSVLNFIGVDGEGVAVLEVVEWEIADIEVTGLRRLQSGYVASRLALGTGVPLNLTEVENALRLLQSDPLIENFDAQLVEGLPGETATLRIDVTEAPSLSSNFSLNNNRSPSVGPTQRGIQVQEGNLLGLGDSLRLGYNGTDGSTSFSLGYTLPLSPRNTTLSFSYATSDSRIIQPPFDFLDIRSTARYYDLTLRHPLVQTPRQEVALGLTLSRWETESSFLEGVLGRGVPLPSLGSDEQGRTRLSVVRLFQEGTWRGTGRVLALRSQFNLGLDAFDATINPDPQAPDGRFFSWQGQGQYIQLLAPDTLLILRGSVQWGDRPLVPLEQFALGGVGTVRGYRRDAITADNGLFFSAETQIPLLRVPELGNGILHLAPFFDIGYAWNQSSARPTLSTPASVGLGLRWQSTGVNANLDWGLPLTQTQFGTSNLRDSTLRLSININPFVN